ncbi:MAG TPA: primosomal protein N' [Ignavibacteria bacterium]|nr:primosomal protein N' [Ignavibacteria bacterium]
MKEFADVVLNLPLDGSFTYHIPEHLSGLIKKGSRVLIKFGKKDYTGVVIDLKDHSLYEKTNPVKEVLDEDSIINEELMNFCHWISSYYLAPLGEVIFSAIPGNINYKSVLTYSLNENYKEKFNNLKTDKELIVKIIALLESDNSEELNKNQICKRLKTNDVSGELKILLDSEVIYKNYRFNDITRKKIVKIVSSNYNSENLNELIIKNKIKSKIQITSLEFLLKNNDIAKPDFIKLTGLSSQGFNSLIEKNLIKTSDKRIYRDRLALDFFNTGEMILNEGQEKVYNEILDSIGQNDFTPFLLFGITGSGKTEIYIRIIKHLIEKGKTAIVLVPEISLTPQLISRFKERFGDIVGVIHSKVSQGERLDTFDRILNNEIKIVVGARSAIFAPLKNIGIIVVDEEHDPSYKQENSPRYNARDLAVVRGKLNNSIVILGSATPSVESFYNCEINKYKLLTLTKRATEIKPPEIDIVNTQKSDKDQLNDFLKTGSEKVIDDFIDFISKVRLKFISKQLLLEIDKRLNKKEQILLLQNRRGFHSYIECLNCGNVEFCPRCSISLTYHKSLNLLKCHYCGFTKSMISRCTTCNSDWLVHKGAGTEKVEEELQKLFPDANIVRLDSDSVNSKKYFENVLKEFYEGKIDILVGTQLISKGLDFPNVTLVGVVNADIGLLNPDFRSSERTFQILTQVAGRSGRANKEGEVLIQTNHPDFKVFEFIKNHNFTGFYNYELLSRKAADYPPFSRLVLIEIKSEDKLLAESKIKEVFNFLMKIDKDRKLKLLPPGQPLFYKLRDKFRYHLLVKSPRIVDTGGNYLHSAMNEVKNYLNSVKGNFQFIIDIDPVDLM